MHVHRDTEEISAAKRSVIYSGHPIPIQRPDNGWTVAEIPCGTCGIGIDLRLASVDLTRRLQRARTAVVYLVLAFILMAWYFFLRYVEYPVPTRWSKTAAPSP
ncbi:MAG: hypothetical protein QOH03_3759 [Kribbellaceae bacterium]|jgi:hypothetical protein|nr:hypothetical protein [Kribbellaceae bacterium]